MAPFVVKETSPFAGQSIADRTPWARFPLMQTFSEPSSFMFPFGSSLKSFSHPFSKRVALTEPEELDNFWKLTHFLLSLFLRALRTPPNDDKANTIFNQRLNLHAFDLLIHLNSFITAKKNFTIQLLIRSY